MKHSIFILLLASSFCAVGSSVTNVSAHVVTPYDGRVLINYELLTDYSNYDHKSTTIEVGRSGEQLKQAKTFEGAFSYQQGRKTIIWDAQTDGISIDETNFICRVILRCGTVFPEYCIVDLSGGRSASNYPITYLDKVPGDGWSDEYKTTKLALKRIDSSSYKMQNAAEVVLSHPYYIGVFEVTQRQWELVVGTRPSYNSPSVGYEALPVETVSRNEVGIGLDSRMSFLDILNSKSGVAFALPTEAQWEYACRAGTSTDYNNGKNCVNKQGRDAGLDEVGRYYHGDPSETGVVGLLKPNAFGLYDMHGNVAEMCQDWYGTLVYGRDPLGPSSGHRHVVRGGSWMCTAEYCTSFYRDYGSVDSVSDADVGFRVAVSLFDDLLWTGGEDGALIDVKAATVNYCVDCDVIEFTSSKRLVGTAIGKMPIYVNEGKVYEGWGEVFPGSFIPVSSSLIVKDDWNLYPAWQESAKKMISFDSNGGKALNPVFKDVDESFGRLPIPEKANYLFAGWFTDRSGGIQVDETMLVKENMILYAHWKAMEMVECCETVDGVSYYFSITNGEAYIGRPSQYAWYFGAVSTDNTEVRIPSELGGYPVVGINMIGFRELALTAVVLPNTLRTLSSSAFHHCKNITDIHIPAGVTNIAVDAFSGCSSLTNITVDCLNSIFRAENGYLMAGDVLILRAPGVRETIYRIPSTCREIGAKALASKGMYEIVFPNALAHVGAEAFRDCTCLTNCVFPSTVTTIGSGCFRGCSGLKNIELSDEILEIPYQAFFECRTLQTVKMPSFAKTIEAQAFYGCMGLKSIKLPQPVLRIGPGAFAVCTNLEKIILPSTIAEIDPYAIPANARIVYCYSIEVQVSGRSITRLYSGDGILPEWSFKTVEVELREGGAMFWSPSCGRAVVSPEMEFVDAGCYRATISEDSLQNLDEEFDVTWKIMSDAQVEIDPREVTVCSASRCKVFDGTPLMDDAVKIGGDGFVTGECKVFAIGSLTDVGECTNSVVLEWIGNGKPSNYTVTTNEGVLSVTKRVVELVAASKTKTYDGTPLDAGDVEIGGDGFVEGECVVDASTTLTNVGSVTNAISLTWIGNGKPSNYSITKTEGVLTVLPAKVSGASGSEPGSGAVPVGGISRFDGAPVEYDGEGHTLNVSKLQTVTLVADVPQFSYSLTSNGVYQAIPPCFTNAGVHSLWYKISAANYEDYVHEARVTILPREITILSGSEEKRYDGTPLSCNDSGIVRGEFVGSDGVTVTCKGIQTLLGESENTFEVEFDSGTIAGNYDICHSNGTLKVVEAGKVDAPSVASAGRDFVGSEATFKFAPVAAGTTIHYTTDGGEPTAESPVYINGVIVTDTTRIRAIAVRYGWFNSEPLDVTVRCSSGVVGEEYASVADRYPNAYSTMTNVIVRGKTHLMKAFFAGCDALRSVTLSDDLVSIDCDAFDDLPNFKWEIVDGYKYCSNWLLGYTDDAVESLTHTDTLKGVANGALEGCTAIHYFTCEAGSELKHVGGRAFYGCVRLSDVLLPDGVENIGNEAFCGCTKMTNFIIPGSVRNIGNSAFKQCTSLTGALFGYGIESIGDSAFFGDWRISEVDIPSSVTNIGMNAFGGDSSMIRVSLRCDLGKKLSDVFSHYANIREVVVKAGDGEIPDECFSGCAELTSVKYLGDCPRVENDGVGLYMDTPEPRLQDAGLVSYVMERSTGWDGVSGSEALPQAWPLSGCRRAIAHWDRPTYLCQFDANGGTLGVQDTYQYSEEKVVLPPEPVQSGYRFAGWWTQPIGGLPVTADTIYIEGVYTYLYAHWIKGRWVFLDPNGGEVVNDFVTYVEESTYGVLPTPVKSGYAFGGWLYGGRVIEPETEINVKTDHTLVAQWTANLYSVRYNANGGTGEMADGDFVYGVEQALRKNVFKKEGFRFVGWSTNETDEIVYVDCEPVSNLTAVANGFVDLFAVWEEGGAVDPTNVQLLFGGDADWTQCYEGVVVTNGEEECRYETIWKSGTLHDGETSVLKTSVFGAGTISFCWKVSCEKWRDERLDGLEFLVDGVSQSHWLCGETDWQYVSFAVDGASEHELQWVYFKDDEGSAGEDCGRVCAIVWTPRLEALSEYVNCTNLEYKTFGDALWMGDITNSHDGVASLRSGATPDGGASVLETTVPGPGKVSFWWKTSCETFRNQKVDYVSCLVDGEERCWLGGERDWTNVVVSVVGGGEHVVQWVYQKDAEPGTSAGDDCAWLDQVAWEDASYVVHFEANGGEGEMTNQIVRVGVADSLATVCFSREGYEFAGWAKHDDAITAEYVDGEIVQDLSIVDQDVITLYAVWVAASEPPVGPVDPIEPEVRNLVTFDLGEHGKRTGGGALTQTVKWGEAAVAPVVEAKAGYRFVKWNVAFDNVKSALTVVAQWEAIEYAISYANTKDCVNVNTNAYTVEDEVVFAALEAPAGWKFVGWSPAKIEKGSTGDKTVTGQWEQIKYAVDIDGVVDGNCVYGQEVAATTFAEKIDGGMQRICRGWVGTGDVPAAGTSNEVTFTVTQASSLKWVYETNYWVSVDAASSPRQDAEDDDLSQTRRDAASTGMRVATSTCEGGTVALKDAAGTAITNELWASAGTNLTAEATAKEGWRFVGWYDRSASASDAQSAAREGTRSTEITVNRPYVLTAEFAKLEYAVAFDLSEHGTRIGGGELKQSVNWGEAAVAPVVQAKLGYEFVGWSVTFDEVKANLVVVAQYEKSTGGVAGETVVVSSPETTVGGTVTWSAKGLPAGMRIAAKDLSDKTYGNVPAGTIYGMPTKPGTYVVKVTAKAGKTSETFEVPVVVGNFVDEAIPVADRYETYRVGAKMTLDLSDCADCTVSGLPSGLKFAKKATTDKDFGAIAAGMVYGIPTKACTNTVTFTKSVSEVVDGKTKKVTHKASATFVVAAAPTWAVGTFNGRRDDGEGGVATMTVGATGKISGKIITGGKTWSFSASGFEAVDESAAEIEELQIVAGAKNGKETKRVRVVVSADGATAMFDEDVPLAFWRNVWKDKGATDVLKDFVGLYTVQLACGESGSGYLSLTLDAKGNCKATGKLPDGTSASGTLPLVWTARGGTGSTDEGAPMAIWQMTPSAYKGGCVGGLLRWGRGELGSGGLSLTSGEDAASPIGVTGEEIVWISQAPGATGEYGSGFSRTMSASGAWYNKLATLSDYYKNVLTFNADAPTLDATVKTTDPDGTKKVTTSETVGIDAAALDCWGALTLSLDAKGSGFVVDQGKATKPVQDKETKEWSYEGKNDAAITFGFTKATGIFKGTFTCWYDYVSATDNTKDPAKETQTHTSKKVSYEGIMVLGEALRGYYLWERTAAYTDEKTGKEKTYKYKESRPVTFE